MCCCVMKTTVIYCEITCSVLSFKRVIQAITGVDAFLHDTLHSGIRITESTLAPSLLCGADSNSMLDISLPMSEGMLGFTTYVVAQA
jgi:hypothetical protein